MSWLLAALVSILIAAAPAGAASGDPSLSAYVTNGPVKAIAVAPDGSVYLGGSFSKVGPRTGSGLLYSEDGGIEPTTGPQEPDRIAAAEVAGGRVRAVAADGSGGWFIGGDFDFVQGTLTRGLAHLDPNGSLDSDWDASAIGGQGRVDALAVSAGTVYVGGDFTTVDGQPRSNIAALDAGDGSLLGWDPGANGSVEALAASGSVVYAGGAFNGTNSIGGEARNHIAALDANSGVVDPAWAPSADGVVAALALDLIGGKLYAGGAFTQVDDGVDSAGPNLVSIDAGSGTVDAFWDPEPDGVVEALMLHDGSLYVGGTFNGAGSIAGVDRDYLAELDASTAIAADWDPSPDGAVNALASSQGGDFIYAGGEFSSIGNAERNHLAGLDISTGDAAPWNPNPDSSVLALAAAGPNVYAGGAFVSAGPNLVDRDKLARLNPNGTVDATWNPGAGGVIAPEVDALLLSGGTLYVGGLFDILDGTPRVNLGALDAATGDVDPGWDPSADDQVLSLALSDDGATLYAGGYFLSLGDGVDSVGPYLGSVETTTGDVDAAWNPAPDHSPVSALAASGSSVYASGGFGHLGGQDRVGLAAIDSGSGDALAGAGWEPPSGAFPFGPDALAVDSGNLYAGGSFTGIAGAGREGIAALDPDSGVPTSWDPDICNGGVHALAVSHGTVYAGGLFAFVNGCSGPVRTDLAAIDAGSGSVTAWDPSPNGAVDALAVSPDGNTVYAGGEFTTVGGRATTYFTKIDATVVGFSATPSSIDFGSHAVGSPSAPQTFTITNDGVEDLQISDVSVTGAEADQFQIFDDQCTGTVIPGASCTVQVFFSPTATGAKTASLEFADNANGSPHDLSLAGNGTAVLTGPAGSLSPPSFSFGARGTGDGPSAAQVFTLTNTGDLDLGVSAVALTGASATQFVIGANTCSGATVTPGDSCTVGVSFSPHSAGAKTAQLEFTDNAADSPQAVSLSGSGVSTTSSPTFGPAGVGPRALETTISKRPKKRSKKRTATFRFASDTPGSAFECSLDKHAFKACSSPMKLKKLKKGRHVFKVRAVDSGRSDNSPASYSWKVKGKKKKKR